MFRRDSNLLNARDRARNALFLKLVRDFEQFPIADESALADRRVAEIAEYIDGLTDQELADASGVTVVTEVIAW